MCKHSDASNAALVSSAFFQFSVISFQNNTQQLSYSACFAHAYVITMTTNVDIRNVQNKIFKTD